MLSVGFMRRSYRELILLHLLKLSRTHFTTLGQRNQSLIKAKPPDEQMSLFKLSIWTIISGVLSVGCSHEFDELFSRSKWEISMRVQPSSSFSSRSLTAVLCKQRLLFLSTRTQIKRRLQPESSSSRQRQQSSQKARFDAI